MNIFKHLWHQYIDHKLLLSSGHCITGCGTSRPSELRLEENDSKIQFFPEASWFLCLHIAQEFVAVLLWVIYCCMLLANYSNFRKGQSSYSLLQQSELPAVSILKQETILLEGKCTAAKLSQTSLIDLSTISVSAFIPPSLWLELMEAKWGKGRETAREGLCFVEGS